MKQQAVQSWFEENKRGTTIKGVARNIILNLMIPLPSFPEQRAIARALRAVQAAREARLRELALERERKAALMERLFVQDNCKVMLLAECAFVQTGVAKGRKFENENNKINVPYLRVANVQDGYLDLEEIQTIEIRQSELKRFLLQPGDILLTEGGDFDKLGRGFIWQGQISQCVHQNHIFAVRVNKSLLIPEYLAYLIQSEYGKAYFLSVAHRTTHLACINSTKLKAFPTLKPDLDRQKEIVDVLGACDSRIAALDHEARLHDELFIAMLEELMSGRLSSRGIMESA
jgi:type I restriction enzyme S subunit